MHVTVEQSCSVMCPTCEAPVGELCRSMKNRHKISFSHARRWDAAKQQIKSAARVRQPEHRNGCD